MAEIHTMTEEQVRRFEEAGMTPNEIAFFDTLHKKDGSPSQINFDSVGFSLALERRRTVMEDFLRVPGWTLKGFYNYIDEKWQNKEIRSPFDYIKGEDYPQDKSTISQGDIKRRLDDLGRVRSNNSAYYKEIPLANFD